MFMLDLFIISIYIFDKRWKACVCNLLYYYKLPTVPFVYLPIFSYLLTI